MFCKECRAEAAAVNIKDQSKSGSPVQHRQTSLKFGEEKRNENGDADQQLSDAGTVSV